MSDHPCRARRVDFDDGNESELARHGISPSEVLQMLSNRPVFARNKRHRAGTWKAMGPTDGGRLITVPLQYDATGGTIRPVTGWDSTPGERTRYL